MCRDFIIFIGISYIQRAIIKYYFQMQQHWKSVTKHEYVVVQNTSVKILFCIVSIFSNQKLISFLLAGNLSKFKYRLHNVKIILIKSVF